MGSRRVGPFTCQAFWRALSSCPLIEMMQSSRNGKRQNLASLFLEVGLRGFFFLLESTGAFCR